jgi:hypothetical protein
LVTVAAGIEDLFNFPLLVFVDDYWRWWWLLMSWDGFGVGRWLEQANMEDWMEFDGGR